MPCEIWSSHHPWTCSLTQQLQRQLGREVLDLAASAITPGITTLELDEIVHNACVERGAYPSPLGYHLFPRSVCTSINEVICHGIPDARPLRDGDILNLDVTLYYGGFHGDLNATYPVGTTVSPQNLALIAAARSCLDEAIRVCKPGYLYRDLGEIIQDTARKAGFSVNQTYCGHGINQQFHCAPNVPVRSLYLFLLMSLHIFEDILMRLGGMPYVRLTNCFEEIAL